MAVFNGLPEAEFQPFRQLAHLVLGHSGHDHQTELAVAVQGVDVVVLEQHPHIVFQQFLGVLDAVQSGTGKAGYLLRDDEVKPPRFGVSYHPIEAVPLFGAGPADALVDVPFYVGPVGLRLDQLGVVLNLVFQAVDLLILVGGNSSVKGHPQGKVKDGFPTAHLIAYPEHIHVRSPPLSSTQDTGKIPGSLSQNVPNQPPRNRRNSI